MELIDTIEKIVKIVAIFIGGAWVYFNATRGRIFTPRLQLEVSGKIINRTNKLFLLVDMSVKNIGNSIAKIKENGTALVVLGLTTYDGVSEIIDFRPLDKIAFPIFDLGELETREIEPGTSIFSQEIIEIPLNKYESFKLELHVTALRGTLFFGQNRKWRSFAIAIEDKGEDQ